MLQFIQNRIRKLEIYKHISRKIVNRRRIDYNKDFNYPQVKLEKCRSTSFALRSVSITMVNSKNKETLSPLGFDPPINRGKLIIRAGRCGFQPHRFGVSH